MKATIFALGTVALGIGLWGSLSPTSNPPARTDDTEAALIASYLVDGTRTHFSADGSASDVLIIGTAKRWHNNDETQLSNIRYQAQDEDGTAWDIDASEGIFFENSNELELKNGVTVIERNGEAAMTTEAMRLYMDENRAEGQHEVVMTGRGSRTVGSAFELDLSTHWATLIGNVSTEYE
jgi:LPS export ABC transporter protein LptC